MGGRSGGGEAAAARADEQARQQRIREGTARINSIFDGRRVGANPVTAGTAFDPSRTFFTRDGSQWTPPAASSIADMYGGSGEQFSSFGGNYGEGTPIQTGVHSESGMPMFGPPTGQRSQQSAFGAAQPSAFADAVARGELFADTKMEGGFDDAFFDKRRQAYLDYATPQIEDQFADAQEQLTFALARGGNLNSSVRGEKAADLQKRFDLAKQEAADKGLSFANEARNNVENARSDLVSMLNATGDAEGAANSAIARAANLSQPMAFSPVGQLFGDFTAGLGQQIALERASALSGGMVQPRYNTGLFGPSRNAVQVKR